MSTLIILGLLAGSVIFLLAALGFLYRYMVRKRLFPQLPRLWMGDRKRFFVFSLIFVCFFGAFFAVSALTQPKDSASEPKYGQRPAPSLAESPSFGRQPASRPATELSARQGMPTTTLAPAGEYRPEPTGEAPAQAPPMAEPGTREAGESMAASTTSTTAAAQETTTSTTTSTTGTTFTTTTTISTTTTTSTTTTSTTTTTLKAPVPQKAIIAPPPGRPKVYTVCATSYRKKQAAQNHAAKLAQKGLKVEVAEVNLTEKGRWFRVCVGKFASANEALAKSRAWRQEGLIADPFIARMR